MTTKKVSDSATVELYARQYAQILAMLDNLREFVATMPAPNENAEIENVDYGYTGAVSLMHSLLKQANDVAYEMSE